MNPHAPVSHLMCSQDDTHSTQQKSEILSFSSLHYTKYNFRGKEACIFVRCDCHGRGLNRDSLYGYIKMIILWLLSADDTHTYTLLRNNFSVTS
jgi:hypothetical protein